MKQNLLIARAPLALVNLLVVTFLCSACVTMPRKTPQPLPSPEFVKGENATRINLNTASAADLEELPGVGKVVAEQIISHREQYGAFRRPEHLMMVRGISERKFRAIRHMITVDSR